MTSPIGTGAAPASARRRKRGGLVGPTVLIFIGGVFLLQNMGWLPQDAWENLWRLWPLILVLAGLELLVGGRLPGAVLALFALIFVVIGLRLTMPGPLTAPPSAPSAAAPAGQTFPTDLNGAQQAEVTVRFGAGQLTLGPLVQAAGATLASMRYEGPGDAPVPRYSVTGGVGRLDYVLANRSGLPLPAVFGRASAVPHLDVDLSPSVPITSLTVQTGATDARLDLSSLQLQSLQVSVGAASTWIRLPRAGVTTARVQGGAATVTLEIPQGVAAQIRQRGGLTTFTIDQSRFPAVGEGLYRSANFDTAHNKVDLDVETGLTTIQIQ